MLKCSDGCLLSAILLVGLAVESSGFLCSRVGPQCSANRQKLELCPELWRPPEVVEDCRIQNKTCRSDREKGIVHCVDEPDGEEIRIICGGEGEFPSLSECGTAYTCTGKGKAPVKRCRCPDNYFVLPVPGLYCVPDRCPRMKVKCKPGDFKHFQLLDGTETSFCYYCHNDTLASVFSNCLAVRGVRKECESLTDEPPLLPAASSSPIILLVIIILVVVFSYSILLLYTYYKNRRSRASADISILEPTERQ